MNVLNSKAGPAMIYVAAGAVVVYLLYRAAKKAGGALAAAADAVNPTSANNLAYRGVNSIGASVTGDQNWSLGGAIYDLLHANYDPNAPAKTNNLVGGSDINGRPTSLR